MLHWAHGTDVTETHLLPMEKKAFSMGWLSLLGWQDSGAWDRGYVSCHRVWGVYPTFPS